VIHAYGRRGHLTSPAGSSQSSSNYVRQPRNTEDSRYTRNTSKNDGNFNILSKWLLANDQRDA